MEPMQQREPGYPTLFTLDEPRRLTTAERVAWLVGIAVYAGAITQIIMHGTQLLPAVIWVPVAHALVLAIICGFTAVLVMGQALASRRRGYLLLGGTYVYVTVVLLLFPLVFPGAIVEGEPLLGGIQSSISLFYSWHFVFPLSLIVSVAVLWSDERSNRRPGLPVGVWSATAIAVALGLLTFALAVAQPVGLLADGELTTVAVAMDVVLVAVSAIAVALTGFTSRSGGQIHRWLFAVALLLLGAAMVNLFAPERWTLGWYFDRLFGMFAMAALFAVLLLTIARLGRVTHTLAASDTLTGCESRAAFTRSLDRELAAGHTGKDARVLLWVDVDGFKSVNDQLGHSGGDQVLRTIVARIHSQVRAGDHVGRLGGDEFGILLCERMGDRDATRVADRILAAIREPMTVGASNVLLSVSIGMVSSDQGAQTSEQLLHQADLAMYAAKGAGGDRNQRFDGDLGTEAQDRAALRHQLSLAIRSRDFRLDFQPIVRLEDGAPVGAEALVRWQRDEERVSAAHFVDFAVGSGQIVPIGRLVVALLERDLPGVLGRLPSDGFVTVNLCTSEVLDDWIIDRLSHGPLAEHARHLVVEVTESAQLHEPDALDRLAALRACGYRIAVDDFGAGFSSFARLEQLDPDLLKVDRSLVARAGSGLEGGAAFLSAAVSVAESLGCLLVAEGLETESERSVCAALGIEWGQGYLLGGPQPSLPRMRSADTQQGVSDLV